MLKRSHPYQLFKVKMTNPLAGYTSNCKNENRWKWKFWNFTTTFCYITPWQLLFYNFNLGFLNIVLQITFYGNLQDKVSLLFSTFLKNDCYPFLIFPFEASNSCYLSYAICIINIFYSVNLASNMVTSIGSIQKSVKI